jgi:hypothetical protein
MSLRSSEIVGSPDDSPTGFWLVDIMAEAATKLRANEALVERCIREEFARSLIRLEGLGSDALQGWMQAFAKNGGFSWYGTTYIVRKNDKWGRKVRT